MWQWSECALILRKRVLFPGIAWSIVEEGKEKIKGRWKGKTKGKSAKIQKGAKVKLQKPGGTQGHFLSIRKSICKDNSYTRDSIIKRVLVRKKVEFLFTVSFFVLFQVSRKNVQAVSILLYFLMYFLCLVFCLVHLMDLEHWDSFVLVSWISLSATAWDKHILQTQSRV